MKCKELGKDGNMYKVMFTFALLTQILMVMIASERRAQGLQVTATIQFGNTGVGSGFPPASGHDQSGNAADKLIPGAVNIVAGGTVTFMIVGSTRHQVTVYPAETSPNDVNTGNAPAT